MCSAELNLMILAIWEILMMLFFPLGDSQGFELLLEIHKEVC